MTKTDPREIARQIAEEAGRRSGRRFLVNDSETGFGRSSYILREGHRHYTNVTVRVSDHSCCQRIRQLYVTTNHLVPGDHTAAIERAVSALVHYAAEEA